MPADGWYEWAKLEDGTKQPYYIHGDGPLYFAALTAWEPGAELDAAHGFAIVTNDAKGGMVDVHDRRPVALPADLAIHWMGPNFPTYPGGRAARARIAGNGIHLAPGAPGGRQFQVPATRRNRPHLRRIILDA